MMYNAIKNFSGQFEYNPDIKFVSRLKGVGTIVVVGMGGSAIAAELIRAWKPSFEIIVHKDYGLPMLSDAQIKNCLVLISSYSGNTEEALSAFQEATERGMSVASISTGGQLLDWSEKFGVPHVQIPDTGIQPRSAIGFMVVATLKLLRDERGLAEISELAQTIKPLQWEDEGRWIAEKLKGYVPLCYASTRNQVVAYNWKIKFNETGKIPAFYNVFPELNHNEMTGFDVNDSTRQLSEKNCFVLLSDNEDHQKIIKRMGKFEEVVRDRGLQVLTVPLKGRTRIEKIFSSLILADWASYYIAQTYGLEPEAVPMVEEFKKLIG